MKIVLFLSDYENIDEFESVFKKLEAYNIKGILAKPMDLTIKSNDTQLTLFFKNSKLNVNLVVGYAFEDDLLPAMKILNTVESYGIPVVNNATTLFNGQNKEISSALLNMARGVRHLPYYKFEKSPSKLDLVDIGFPIVVKPLTGACGRGLHKFDSYNELYEWCYKDISQNGAYYAQPYIPKNLNRDFRIVAVDYNACYAYERKAPEGGWITNICADGIAAIVPIQELCTDIIKMSELAARAVNAPFCGIDIALDENMEPFIIEANTCPAIKISNYIKGASDTVEIAFASFINKLIEVADGK